MKRILVCLAIVIVFFSLNYLAVYAVMSVSGNWSQTVNSSNLTSGAGSNLASTYDSAANATLITGGDAFPHQFLVCRVDGTWNDNFHIYVIRTGNGTPNVDPPTEGTSFQEVTTTYAYFFTTNSYTTNIPIQYELTGMSLGVAPGTYTTTVYYKDNSTLETGSITVTITVSAIKEFAVSANPSTMNVSTATAGSQPNEVTDSSTAYGVSTNGTSKRITGNVGSALPNNVTLKVNLTAPSGGSSAGDVSLTTSDQNLVTGISNLGEGSKTITYKLSAPVSAGVVNSTAITVTFTVAD